LLRVASNPFFPYMIGRIEEGIDGRAVPATDAEAESAPPSGAEEDERWSLRAAIATILNLMRDRSDPSPAPP
jgi:hypothetical protein